MGMFSEPIEDERHKKKVARDAIRIALDFLGKNEGGYNGKEVIAILDKALVEPGVWTRDTD